MPPGFSNKGLNAIARVTSAASLITMLALGASGVYRVRRDITLTSYDRNIQCWETGSGTNLGNTGSLTIQKKQKGCIDVNGNLSISGSLISDGVTMGTGFTIPVKVSTSDSNIVRNTTTETLFTTNYVIPANSVVAGDSFRIFASGSGSQISDEATARVKIGNVNVMTFSGAYQFINEPWMMDSTITFRTAGASAQAIGSGIFNGSFDEGNSLFAITGGSGQIIAVDTTQAQTLQMSWRQNTASAASYAVMRQFIVEKIRPNQ